MLDLLMLVLVGVALAGAAGYVCACADLTQTHGSAGDEAP